MYAQREYEGEPRRDPPVAQFLQGMYLLKTMTRIFYLILIFF